MATTTKHRRWLKKLELQELCINPGMFDYPIYVIVGPETSITPYVRWKFDDAPFAHANDARGCVYHRENYPPVLWIPRKPRVPGDYAVLAHECIHAVMHMLRWAGVPANQDTEEVLTHATQYIMEEVLTRLKW